MISSKPRRRKCGLCVVLFVVLSAVVATAFRVRFYDRWNDHLSHLYDYWLRSETWVTVLPTGLVFKGESRDVVRLSMGVSEADAAYFRYMSRLHFTCSDSVRLGNADDGGWDACLVGPYRFGKPCLVYSFGINYDFSFDDAVADQFGCTVRAFDPSMDNTTDHVRNSNIWFYKIGLGGNDTTDPQGWTVRTLPSIVQLFNDSDRLIDYLKFDVESSEWSALEAMYRSDVLGRVKQLAIEIHIMPIGTVATKIFYEKWAALRRLEEFGFRRWYWHLNKYGAYMPYKYSWVERSCCYEMVYINTNFL